MDEFKIQFCNRLLFNHLSISTTCIDFGLDGNFYTIHPVLIKQINNKINIAKSELDSEERKEIKQKKNRQCYALYVGGKTDEHNTGGAHPRGRGQLSLWRGHLHILTCMEYNVK